MKLPLQYHKVPEYSFSCHGDVFKCYDQLTHFLEYDNKYWTKDLNILCQHAKVSFSMYGYIPSPFVQAMMLARMLCMQCTV
jgi:hypothetical protein